MIYESYPWKQDLLRRKRLIIKYNRTDLLYEDNDDRAHTIIEKAVFYSAFIIRKLIDCKVKVSDDVDNYKFKLKAVRPLKNVNLLHRWPDENTHDWANQITYTKSGADICNWLIHSFIFYFGYDENETIDSFYVSSDFDKNKLLYRIDLKDWITYMDFVGNDSIVAADMHLNSDKKEYELKKKERGKTQ